MAKSNRSAEKESFWRLVLEEQQESELTVRAFCQREGISEASFYAWRKEIKKRDSDAKRGTMVEQQSLIPVNIVDSHADGSRRHDEARLLEVLTPSGFTLRFHQDIEPRQLNTLLSVVASSGRYGAEPC